MQGFNYLYGILGEMFGKEEEKNCLCIRVDRIYIIGSAMYRKMNTI